ncbi:MAG: hypothetical protein A2066_02810 [Bacteroidetes bacterium GWB2_41_8]|nr:MAG: hypothetical protein A2066_02810 [Bacteroidetes bacterium GWB2_41_8]
MEINMNQIYKQWQALTVLLISICIAVPAFAQNNDTTTVRFFTGATTLTTKGLSTFPNLTLGKPAAIFDFSIGGEKLRFEPTLRFGLDGKPWTFIFWLRYELLKTEKFQFKMGAHPAYSFKTITVAENGNTNEMLRTQQFLAGDIAPLFYFTKNISAGPYYLYSRGVTEDAVRNSNFISFRTNFSNIKLTDNYFMRLMAQAYYLKMDTNDGFYVNSTLSLNKRNFPFSVSSTVNKTIESTIPGDNFLWNINLTYAFGDKYRKL